MAVLDIVLHPDDRLRAECKPVEQFDDELQTFIDDMIDTMYDAPGVGLAAPQVGRNLQITVIDVRDDEDDSGNKPDEDTPKEDTPALLIFINPKIVERSKETIAWEEGCLSIPGVYQKVKRHRQVVVEALDRHGEPFSIEADDNLLCVCLQHEIDHLKGILFLDHLSRIKLRMAMKTYKRSKPQYISDLKKKRDKQKQDADA